METSKADSQLPAESEKARQSATSTANDEHISGNERRLTCEEGILMSIGKCVKSAVGGAVDKLTGSAASPKTDSSFSAVCEKAMKLLTKLHTKHRESVVHIQVIEALEKTKESLEQKDICISVFGSHNCGKSTLLNALIGEELLPVCETNETSVKIKVRHDGTIHQGVCTKNCPHLHSQSLQQSKSCPKLQVTKPNNKYEIQGAENIYVHLTELNKKVREQSLKEPLIVILKANIPLLAGKVPPGWTVSLMDNPGFGEAKEHVVQLAEASMVTSSAYIYLLQTENIEGTEVEEFFKELIRKDETAMTDGRLTVAITKFDANYNSSKSRRRGHKPTQTTVDDVKKRTRASIMDATKAEVPVDTIIPLYGEWALYASRLAKCIIDDPDNEIKARKKDAAKVLKEHPHLFSSGGQEQSYSEFIKGISPEDLVSHLEKASGITNLKDRIDYVVGKACVKVWATKILAEFQRYLKAVEGGITDRFNCLNDCFIEKADDYSKSKHLYSEIMKKKESIKATAPRTNKKKTQIWKEFEESYMKDLEDRRPQDEGKVKVGELIRTFKDECQQKISSKCFGPEDFVRSIKVFLDESGPKLQRVFDMSCSFWNVQDVLMDHVERMVEIVTKIRSETRILCKMDAVSGADTHLRETQLKSKALKTAPNLGDIKLKVKIPSVSLLWWEKIIKFFRDLHVKRKDSESQNVQPSCDIGSGDSQSSASGSQPEEQQDQESNSDLESDENDDENDNKGPADRVSESFEKKSVASASSASNVVSDIQQNASTKSTCHREDETDGSSNRRTIYRKWTKELDEAMNDLQYNMEVECDNYFEVIKPKAIKYFYKEYSRRTHHHLSVFDEDFHSHLEDENKRTKKLNAEMESLRKECEDLQRRKIDLRKLHEELLIVYSTEFGKLQ